MATCKDEHRFMNFFSTIPEDQSLPHRHKCAGCAYQYGYSDGLKNVTPDIQQALSDIPKSQAGFVRHKSAVVAYYRGYAEGVHAFYLQQLLSGTH